MDKYIPPFEISNNMLELVSDIMEKIGNLNYYSDYEKMPILIRNNRFKSIHSSLAIEANSLSLDQVKDVISGRYVTGPQKEIQEVKNAYKAYDMINDINPYSIEELLRVHSIMTNLTIEESGKFRSGAEGVFDERGNCIFIAPQPEYVKGLIENLFIWLNENKNKIHPLILSSVFHYEFIFIHPFSDGNGRTVRLWQNILLSKWKPIFQYVPIETQIQKHQSEYYQVINDCNKMGNSNLFIEFMLRMINEILDELIINSKKELIHSNSYVKRLLDVMDDDIPMSSLEIMNLLGLKSKDSFRDNYLKPALENGLIHMTIPDKPTSKNQKYYKN